MLQIPTVDNNTRLRTLEQNSRLHVLLSKLYIDKSTKEELVYLYTEGRETSSAKMTYAECERLIDHLRKHKFEFSTAKCDKMRKRIIALCHEMGWENESGKVEVKRINEFCLTKGVIHKQFNQYTVFELPTLIYQFEQIYKSYLKSL